VSKSDVDAGSGSWQRRVGGNEFGERGKGKRRKRKGKGKGKGMSVSKRLSQ